MSIHVISAVLNCRDPELTSSRRMVLVCLANYAGDDGHSWPSQQLIADESGCGIRSVKDHLKWLEQNGFIIRKTKSLGQGNGSRTSYHILLSRLSRTQPDAGAQIAGANNARANSRSCEGSIPPLTNRQEPSIPTDTDVSVGHANVQRPDFSPEQPKRKPSPRGAARGSRIPPNWAPQPQDYAFASNLGLSREEINHEHGQFRDHWSTATGKGSTKLDWSAAWRTWIRNTIKWRAERTARTASSQNAGRKPAGGGLVAAGLRAVSEARGYGQPVSEGRGMGAGDVIDGDTFRLTGS